MQTSMRAESPGKEMKARRDSCCGNEVDVRIFDSIDRLDKEEWDFINKQAGLFHSYRFVRSVERARVMDAQFWYLIFYNHGLPVGSAVLSAFEISLDLLMGNRVHRAVRFVRKIYHGFLKIKVLFCGLPVSIGKNSLTVTDLTLTDAIIDRLADTMSDIADSQGINFICAKEFREEELPLIDGIKRYGFFRANSVPAVGLPVRWASFDSYLGSLRHGYRRQILKSIKKLEAVRPFPEDGNGRNPGSAVPQIITGRNEICTAEKFHELYMHVMRRAEIRLETLNAGFFEQLFRNLPGDLQIIAFTLDSRILGVLLLAGSNGTLHFLFAGLDYDFRDQYDVYFNLIYSILDLAIKDGYCDIDLGQTSYGPKLRLGGECSPVYFYLRVRRPLTRYIVRCFRGLLFPELRLERPRVFRTEEVNNVTHEANENELAKRPKSSYERQ